MDEHGIRYLLGQLKIPLSKVNYTGSVKHTRWMQVTCPFAFWTHGKGSDSNPSFGITIKGEDQSFYKCLSCGIKGRLSGLPTRLGGYRKKDYSTLRMWAISTEFKSTVARPVPAWDDTDTTTIDYSESTVRKLPDPDTRVSFPMALGLRYLRDRGISYQDVMQLDLRYDRYQKRILFPVYDHGRFSGFTGRSVLSLEKWTREIPKVKDYFGLNKRSVFLSLPGTRSGRKIIGEGLFDYAKFVKFGYLNARAILGTAITEEKAELLIEENEPVYFFMDNDLAGWNSLFGIFDKDGKLETGNAWAYRLYKEIPVWIVPYNMPLNGADPGAIPDKETMDRMINRAWLFTGRAPLDDAGSPTLQRPKLKRP